MKIRSIKAEVKDLCHVVSKAFLKNINSLMNTETMIHVGGRIYLPVDEIYLLKAELNYTKIFLNDGSNLLSSTNLGKIEERLSGHSFVRPNRSTVISWHSIYIIEIQHSRIILKNREVFSISRKRKKQFSNLQCF